MRLGLGMDTGGTYTDAVLYDFDEKKAVAWGKALTTREDLTRGIAGALDTLPGEMLARVQRTALSTTLATNVCVEGKGGRSRLVLIGCQPKIVETVGPSYGLPPVEDILFAEGGHDRQGRNPVTPDWEALREKVLAGDGDWQAYAVVEIWGARNPAIEVEAREKLRAWTGKPVVAGHEITGTLDAMKRAASALLNARLLPVIADFLAAVEKTLRARNVAGPIAIVRGDGTLMTREFAALRPIETLLCGPASSVLGGARLSGLAQAMVVDMGGTTSDIALIRDGLPVMAPQGAAVGGWRTGVASIDIETIGLGGDSRVTLADSRDGLAIGPQRVIPLVTLAARDPRVAEQLIRIRESQRRHSLPLAEFFLRQREAEGLEGAEKRLYDALAEGPLSLEQLAEKADVLVYHVDRTIRPLEQAGLVIRSALTPTDALHALGKIDLWPKAPAEDALAILALNTGEAPLGLAARILTGVSRRLHGAAARMLLRQRWPKRLERGLDPELEDWIEAGFAAREEAETFDGGGDFLRPRVGSRVPLVGVGAPVAFFLPEVARAMGCPARVDGMAPVANALGAVTAGVTARVVMTVKPDPEAGGPGGFHVYGAPEKPWFARYEDALAWARERGRSLATEQARQQGAGRVACTQEEADKVIYPTRAQDTAEQLALFGGAGEDGAPETPQGIRLETRILTRADGEMDWNRLDG